MAEKKNSQEIKKMRIVFFGTSPFARPSLEAILESRHNILAVITQPDRKKGRNLVVTSPPVKVLALKHNLKVHQPDRISSPDFIEILKNYKADIFAVVSFGQILKKEVLKIPKHFCLNLHGSLLPKYRGPAPINWVIINGESISGVTVIKMEEKVDRGDILLKKEVKIEPNDNALTLSDKLSKIGAQLLVQALNLIETGKIYFTPQDEQQVTSAPKLKRSDGLINWQEEAVKIHNKTRGLFPWPGTFVNFNGKILKIVETEISELEKDIKEDPGTIVDIRDEGFIIQTGKGLILIKQVQLEGSRVMSAKQFSLGHRIKTGMKL